MSGRHLRFALGVALVAVLGLTTGSLAATGGGGKRSQLDKTDRALLSARAAAGEEFATMLLVAKRGETAEMVAGIQAAGGLVAYRHDSLGYVRASMPIAKIAVVDELDSIQAADVDQVLPLPSPVLEAVEDEPQAAPDATTPPVNPWLPAGDIGGPQFRQANPTYDGRGVVIGILDSGVDVTRPELQTAKTLAGASVPKIVDWVAGTDPLTDGDASWVKMETQVSAPTKATTFTFAGATYTAPERGDYRIGVFDEALLCANPASANCETKNNVNLDGDGTDKYAVLWDEKRNRVWVDTDQDLSFADQKSLQEFAKRRDWDKFGVDNATTAAIVEEMPFVVDVDAANKYVNVGLVASGHGTHVAGIAAGKGYYGGAFDGVAPEAQVVSVRGCLFGGGCTSHALIEGMIYLADDARADVINMSIGGLPALNDGNNARAELYNRLIEDFKVQIFLSQGNNGPGVNTSGDPSVTTNAVAVGAYQSAATWAANYDSIVPKTHTMWPFSSRGPREDGGFKPNITAPGSAVSTWPTWNRNVASARSFVLPPGVEMIQGTSMASPHAAGGAALIVSALKQNATGEGGLKYRPELLRQALNSTATFVPGYQAHEQGNGLMNVPAAWELFRQTTKRTEVTALAPVNTILASFLKVPFKGTGIHEREGWRLGDAGVRTITLTRAANAQTTTPIAFALTWVGNDGTYGSAGSISLAPGESKGLDVTVTPTGLGAHSAILNVDDPATPGIDNQVMNTVVVPNTMTAANNFTAVQTGSADRADSTATFFDVPTGATALRLDLGITNVARARIDPVHPWGLPLTADAFVNGPTTRTVFLTGPTPGVWEFSVETSRAMTTPITGGNLVLADPQANFSMSTTVLGVKIEPSPAVVDPTTIGTDYTRSFTITNLFGPFTGNAVAGSTALRSASEQRPSVAQGAKHNIPIVVPAGATQLQVRIGNPADPAADLDLFVYNSAGQRVAQQADGDSEEAVTINLPANFAGDTFRAEIDGFAVPAGTTAFDYSDTYLKAGLGTLAVTDASALRPAGASWTVPATARALASPGAGRFLQGIVQVRASGVTIGEGQIRLLNVS
jgi:hypothetical protein